MFRKSIIPKIKRYMEHSDIDAAEDEYKKNSDIITENEYTLAKKGSETLKQFALSIWDGIIANLDRFKFVSDLYLPKTKLCITNDSFTGESGDILYRWDEAEPDMEEIKSALKNALEFGLG